MSLEGISATTQRCCKPADLEIHGNRDEVRASVLWILPGYTMWGFESRGDPSTKQTLMCCSAFLSKFDSKLWYVRNVQLILVPCVQSGIPSSPTTYTGPNTDPKVWIRSYHILMWALMSAEPSAWGLAPYRIFRPLTTSLSTFTMRLDLSSVYTCMNGTLIHRFATYLSPGHAPGHSQWTMDCS